MRKLLLASAAILGASGGLALAQVPANPSQGQLAAPYGSGPAKDNNNNAWGIANTPSGSPAAGPLSTIYAPNVIAVPAPGTIVIRLNGRVETDISATFSNLNSGSGRAASFAFSANPSGQGFKLNPIGVGSYVRLYPGFDGVSANGLRYGAAVEIRENFYAGTNGTTNGGSTGTAASTSGNISAQTLFVRQAFSYLASDQAGLVRIGQGSGVLSLFDNCIFTTQCWDAGVGVLNGNGLGAQGPSGAQPPWVWLSQAAADVANNKIVYLSPQFYGFDAAVQYAPSEGNAFATQNQTSPLQSNSCNQAGQNCISVTSGNDSTRWYNQVGGGARYQQTFGAVDFKIYGFAETAGKEDLTTSPYATTLQAREGASLGNGVVASANNVHYDNLGFYKAGIAVTTLNLTFAVDYIGGAVNGQLQMRPSGGVNEHGLMPGVTYANGPITAGVQVGFINSQGDARLVGISQRREWELATGGAYKLAPGVQLVAEYQYAYRHQGDYNFATATIGSTNNAISQQIMFDTVLTW